MRQGPEQKKGRGQAAGAAVAIAVGILLRENRILVTQRREGTHLAGSWEFPGGKILPGEVPEAALRREIEEEVGVHFEKATLIHRQLHAYTERQVELFFFLCTGITEEPAAREGQELRWVSASDLDHLQTPAANADVIRMIQDQLG